MNKQLIQQVIPSLINSFKGSPYEAMCTPEALEHILKVFTTATGVFSSSKQVSCILKIAHIDSTIPKEKKITDEIEFVLPLFIDDRAYQKGDEVAIHEELENPKFGLRPIVFRVVHYALSNAFTDIALIKTIENNKAMYDEYVAACRKINLKTLLEENQAVTASVNAVAEAAILDKKLDDVAPVAPGPVIVEP